MTPRRIFAGIILAMLLSATSVGAACEISCTFAQSGIDCHSLMAQAADLNDSPSQMDGMDMSMSAMPLPNDSNGDGIGVSSLTALHASHPTIGEMGPCERQSCDERSVAVRSGRSLGQQLHANVFIVDLPRIAAVSAFFHHTRAEDFPHRARDASPPVVSLRI